MTNGWVDVYDIWDTGTKENMLEISKIIYF